MRNTTLLWRRGEAFVAQHGNVVGVRWTGVPTKEQLAALVHAHRSAREHGDVVLLDEIRRLDGPTRVDASVYAEMIELIRSCRGRTRAVAHVVPIRGLAGEVVRGFLDALERVGGGAPTRVAAFDHANVAARWLHEVGGPATPSSEELHRIWSAMERVEAVPMAA